MKKITKKLEGKIIQVGFMDHAIGCIKPVLCAAIGEVLRVDEASICLRYWKVLDKDMGAHNDEILVIITSTILTLRVLR